MNTKLSPKLCECGCGQPAPIAKRNNSKLGHIKGQPVRFIAGHATKGRIIKPAEDRFWAKVIRRGPDECWDWNASDDGHGYGRLQVNGSNMKAHRYSYELHNGPIPEGLDCLHKCDYPPCTNPKHLFLGTAKDNVADAKHKGRAVAPPRISVKGERNGHATLTDERVMALRREFAVSDLSLNAFAKMHNIKMTTLHAIIQGRSWSHLPIVKRGQPHRYTDEQIIQWRKEFGSAGITIAAFAKLHSVPYSKMHHLIVGDTYKHLLSP